MTEQLELRVQNLDCEHDAAAIRRALAGTPGLAQVTVYPKSAKVRILYDPDVLQPQAIEETLAAQGFPAQEGMALPGATTGGWCARRSQRPSLPHETRSAKWN